MRSSRALSAFWSSFLRMSLRTPAASCAARAWRLAARLMAASSLSSSSSFSTFSNSRSLRRPRAAIFFSSSLCCSVSLSRATFLREPSRSSRRTLRNPSRSMCRCTSASKLATSFSSRDDKSRSFFLVNSRSPRFSCCARSCCSFAISRRWARLFSLAIAALRLSSRLRSLRCRRASCWVLVPSAAATERMTCSPRSPSECCSSRALPADALVAFSARALPWRETSIVR
mmetsp:Transcript_17566/g.41394  ORF Transcript_17566/g.41394 Transcript_17566/m.41394 type:complete len:229 (+) Transcript_17566:1005-1691(+)